MVESDIVASLFEWQSPDEMASAIEDLAKLLGHDVLQRRGRAYREAYIALRLARAADQDQVRLLPETHSVVTPDFEVRKGDTIKRYETTEADIPGRRRQAEYRNPRPAGVEPIVFTSLDIMVEHMRELAAKKAAKPYADCSGLVIHLNPPAFSFDPAFRTEQMRIATEPASAAFDEVWVVRDKGVLLWKAGEFLGHIPDDF